MGRVRAKGKKLMTSHDDAGSDGDEKIPAQKRRGRPQKPLKDEIDDVEAQKIEDEESEDNLVLLNKDTTNKAGKKRKKNAQAMEKVDSVKEENGNGNGSKSSTEENGNGSKSSTEETVKSNGFRQSGNRRKNKPHRAAEAVVECN